MKLRLWIILFGFLLVTIKLSSQETVIQQQISVEFPSPLNLSPRWWQYFEVVRDELEDRIEQFTSSLEKIVEQTPENIRTKAEKIEEQIRLNFSAYLLARRQEITPLPPPQPFEKSYSIQSLLDIHRTIRNKQTLLEASFSEKDDLSRQIATATQRIENLNSKYRSLDERSQERLLEGMNLIAFRISLETAKERLKNLNAQIVNSEEEIRRAKAEQQAAIQNLHSDPNEIQIYENRLEEAKKNYEETEQELNKIQSESITSFTFVHQTNQEFLNSRILQLKVLETKIHLGSIENQLILYQIEKSLSLFLNSPSPKLSSELENASRNWSKGLSTLLDQIEHREREIKRELLRIQEIFPFEQEYPEEIKQLQETAVESAQSIVIENQRLKLEVNDAQFMLRVLHEKILSLRGVLSKWFSQSYNLVLIILETIIDSANRVLFYIGTTPITIIGILTFSFIFLITLWISHILRLAITRFSAGRRGIHRGLLYRMNRLIHYSILILGLIIGLSMIGFDFTNFVLIAGALGVGLGFGLQSIFNNFFSGLIILFESQLKVGDFIELEEGIRGEVKEINFRSTYIQTNDGLAVIIPNSEFINHKVINWTLKEPYRRLRIPFMVSYDSDKDLVARVVEEAAKAVPYTLLKEGVPAPKVYIEKLADDGILFELGVWVDPKATKKVFSTTSLYLWAIHDVLEKNEIDIPFPQRTIRFADENIEFKKSAKKKNRKK